MTGIAPPRYRLTQHALDQATAMGVTPDEVRACITNPLVDVPSDVKDDCRLAHDGRIKAVYNATTGDVVTVFWLSHDWQPDRYQEPEQPMSGWINLSAREAEKLLEKWGFEVAESKQLSNLWTHPDDPEKRLIPFAIPARGSKANGKSSYRTAAQVCGVSVAVFLKGPTDEALEDMRRKRQMAQVRAADDLMDAPDPLGINTRIATDAVRRVASEILIPAPLPHAEENDMTLTANDEKVLQALIEQHAPVASYALAASTGLTDRNVRGSLRKLEKLGDAHRVGTVPSRSANRTGGSPASLWWYETTFSEPTAPDPEPTTDPYPEENPVLTATPQASGLTALSQAAMMQEATASVALDKGDGQTQSLDGGAYTAKPSDVEQRTGHTFPIVDLTQKALRVFEETEIRWPTGGIVIKDDQGNLYVARALTEEGR